MDHHHNWQRAADGCVYRCCCCWSPREYSDGRLAIVTVAVDFSNDTAPPCSHHCCSCSSRRRSPARHDTTTSMGHGICLFFGVGMPNTLDGSRCANICGKATLPVPPNNNKTLFGQKPSSSSLTRLGMESVLSGLDNQILSGSCSCTKVAIAAASRCPDKKGRMQFGYSHDVKTPLGYIYMRISTRPRSHSKAPLIGV